MRKTRKAGRAEDGPVILRGPWRQREADRFLREPAKARNVEAVWTFRGGKYVRVPVDRLGA